MERLASFDVLLYLMNL